MAFLKSARSVETVTEIGYHRCDRGLYLQVAGSGTKSWLFRYKSPVTGKQREMGLGSLNLVSLASARDIAVECRRQVLSGLDPLEERGRVKRVRQLEQARSITFQEAAEKCIASKKPEWKNAKHAQQWANSLTTYAYPVFGTLSVSDLDTDLVLKAIEPIWNRCSRLHGAYSAPQGVWRDAGTRSRDGSGPRTEYPASLGRKAMVWD